MSRSADILQALAVDSDPLTPAQIAEALGDTEDGAAARVGAMCTYLKGAGRVQIAGKNGCSALWSITAAGRQSLGAESALVKPKVQWPAAKANGGAKPKRSASETTPPPKANGHAVDAPPPPASFEQLLECLGSMREIAAKARLNHIEFRTAAGVTRVVFE